MVVSFSWNVRGFNNKIKRRKFSNWLHDTKPLFGSITETRIRKENFEGIIKEFPGWRIIGNYEHHDLGRIWVFGSNLVDIIVISKTAQAITCNVTLPSSEQVVVTFIYGATCRYLRQELWTELRLRNSAIKAQSTPWLVLGDFNEILTPTESSSEGSRISNGIKDFRDCMEITELWDLPFRGPTFTWWNSQEAHPLAKKLDRILVNEEWRIQFPQSYANFESMSFSDHRLGTVTIGSSNRRKISFKVSNYLLDHPRYLETLAAFWDSTHFAGTAMYCLTRKLKALKPVLKSFNYRHYSDLEQRTVEAYQALQRAQSDFMENPTTHKAKAQKDKLKKWWELADAEDKFLRQRARIKWIKEGDRNTSFFHKSIQSRRATNYIHYLQAQGIRLEKKEDMADHSIAYFSGILGTEAPSSPQLLHQITSLTKFRCDQQMKELLQSDVSDSDIKQEIFALPKRKCPGPDGYTAEFFVKSWPIIGDDVISAVREFFHTGYLLKQLNATNIALIPKFAGADSLPNFRPISLCNVLYKVISKILTRRIQMTLPHFISSNQTAFVRGRSLVENVILATELVKGFGTKSQAKRGALKVDLSKAFDTVKWDFIFHILEAAEFPPIFIGWLRECVTTPSFSVCLNGEPCGFFKGKRGLRQGDPLSPSLFLIAMQIFSDLLEKEFEAGNIKLHDLCRDPMITHLSFADDIMVFFDGEPKSLQGIIDALRVFKDISGLSVNISKTTAYLTGLSPTELADARGLGFGIGTLPVRYLGLPLLTRRMRKADYFPLLDSLSKRFSNWTTKSLSFAGRLQLLSSVTYSLTNFWMGAFLLPKGCIREITQLCNRFLWGGDTTKAAHVKVSWKAICLPKSEGGLGLRDFSTWNKTIQLKLIWSLLTKEGSLWVDWIKRHWLKKNNFWTALVTPRVSWTWRTLLHLRPLVQRFVSCRIGNGEQASFWDDHWHDSGPLIRLTGPDGPQKMGIPRHTTVAQAVMGYQTRPSTGRTRCTTLAEITSILCNLQSRTSTSTRDQFFWGEVQHKLPHFSVKRTWELLRPKEDTRVWTRVIWSKRSSPKHSFLFWIITLNRLPLRSRLRSWGIDDNDTCFLCSSSPEERNHLFLTCDFVLQIWEWVAIKLQCTCLFQSWESLLAWIGASPSTRIRTLRIIASQVLAYTIWMERNNRLHNGTICTVTNIKTVIDKTVRASLLALRSRKHHMSLLSMWFAR